jgi:hypothetical protein
MLKRRILMVMESWIASMGVEGFSAARGTKSGLNWYLYVYPQAKTQE